MAPSFLRRCKKCGEEYHPIEQSAECPHEKIEPQPDEGLWEEVEEVAEFIYECNRGIWSGRKRWVYWYKAKPKVKEFFRKQASEIFSKAQAHCEAEKAEIIRQNDINLDGTVTSYEEQLKRKDAECEERVREEREVLQQHMMGFPRSLYPISEKCLCAKWNCKWFEKFAKRKGKDEFPIGWCKRFESDPDAGYVMAYQLPPCVVWAVDREALRKGEG